MNQNRPFYSTNTNLYDEFFRSSSPTTLNGESVILSQEQQRRVCDTLNTSIVGNPFGINGNQQMLYAQKQYFPGGVLFTFPSFQFAPQNIPQETYCKCAAANTLPKNLNYFHQPAAAVNTFFPSSVEYQQGCGGFGLQQAPPLSPLREAFKLKFHHDQGTSCSDLLNHSSQVPASKGLPDLCNINGVLQQNPDNLKTCQTSPPIFFPSPPIEFSSNAKKLVLSKSAPPPCGHVVDILGEDASNESNKKAVSFSDPSKPITGDKSSQITNNCICDAKKCESKSKTKKGQISSPVSSDCEDNGENSRKPKKKRWWDNQKKRHSGSDSQSSDSEDDKAREKRKKKKKNTKNKTKTSSESESASDASNSPGFDSEKSHIE